MGANMGPFHKELNPLLLLQRFDVDTHGKDPDDDESTLVGTGTAARGVLDLDAFWEGLERKDPADGLPEVTGVARSLEADEIGSEETME
jgi:hypothetical protein